MTLINSTVKYRDLGGSATVKIWWAVYRDTVKTAHPYYNVDILKVGCQ